MADILDFLFQGSPPPNVTSTSIQTTGTPEWYTAYLKGLAERSNAIAGTSYTPSPVPQVAPQNADQLASYDVTRNQVNSWNPGVTTAEDTLTNIAGQNVDGLNDEIARLGARNLNERLIPQIDQTFIGAGQFGGDRHEKFYQNAVRDTNESVIGAQAQAFLQNQAQRAGAATNLGTLGQIRQQLGLRDAAALESIGQSQRSFAGENLSAAQRQFEQERDYPKEQAAFLNQMLRGLNVPQTTNTTTNAPFSGQMGSSGLSTLLGGALGFAALKDAFKKDGGRVRRLSRGGPLSQMRGQHPMARKPMFANRRPTMAAGPSRGALRYANVR